MLTEEQIRRIKEKICIVLDRKREPLQEIDEDIDPDYAKGRNEQEITKIIYNAFQPETQDIDGITIAKRTYGKNMTLPELLSDGEVYQIYNHTAEPYNTDEVKERVRELDGLFHTLEFTISGDTYELTKLEIVSFDGFTDKGRAKISDRTAA